MNSIFADYNIYSRRLGFYYNNKEKISTWFGLILTLIYILSSITLFIYFINNIMRREQTNVYDTKVYSQDIPMIEVNPNLIYFAFGLEDKSSNRFADETIYFPKILFFERKKENGDFKKTERRELEYEICNVNNFGEEYKKYFIKDELNNSYCLKDYNLSLIGGYKYDRMSYFRIKLYPCLNNTENNNHCKPKDIIDQYLKGGHFYIITKDIGLNPTNYSFPIVPTLQDLYTTIDKQIFRDFNLYYGITEIQTDVGLLYEDIKSQKYLQFRKEVSSFYFRDESDYYGGKAMISITFKLDDFINIQKRKYSKLPEILSIIGGYMQLLHTIFSVLSILPNKLIPQLKILNGIFNFNLNQRKLTMKIHSIKDFISISFLKNPNNCMYLPNSKNRIRNNNNNTNNISKNTLIGNEGNISSIVNIINKKNNSSHHKIENKSDNSKISFLMDKKLKNNNNIYSKNNFNQNFSKNKNYIYRVGSFYPKKLQSIQEKENENDFESDKNNNLKDYIDKIKINIFEYYCFRKLCKKKKEINLFDSGISLFRRRMDIVNVFTLLFLTEKIGLQIEN